MTARLADAADALAFSAPVAMVYNPLRHARLPLRRYIERYGGGRGRVLLLGMNPGPFGMAQTGVPFGDVEMARSFLGVEAPVEVPAREHPKRPVEGFGLTRREVSGSRLWGWAQERFGTAEAFFRHFFVVNWCPLVFMADTGRNVTPDKLAAAERDALVQVCDRALAETIEMLSPRRVIGVGAFAEARAAAVLEANGWRGRIPLGRVLHPSPASPKANRGWAAAAEAELVAQGVDVAVL
ncbi:MAG: single-stranded DNA-binding protein, partial [Deltaproteobacteria bacterium]